MDTGVAAVELCTYVNMLGLFRMQGVAIAGALCARRASAVLLGCVAGTMWKLSLWQVSIASGFGI
jgi:hypothetical protein